MVVDQIRQIDTSGDNQIDENELREAIKPNGFLYKEENLHALGNLLNNGGVEGADQELLSSLEQSFYTLKTNILKKDKITEEEKKLLIVYKNILGGKCDDELKEINDFIKHQEEIERQEQEIQMQEQENTRIYNEILQEVETEISATQDNYIENLISLGIKPNTQLNRNKLRENIKTLDDIEKIDETNIKEYIKIPDDVPSANYEYIANNIKIILNVHLQLHPNWKSIVGTGGLAINMDIGNLLDNNRYLSKIIKEINGIQDIDQQISFCINKFPDGNYLDLCLKRILSSKKYKPEDISKKIFEKIPIQKSENFFKTCDKNPFINGLKSDYVLYWLNKNNSIKTGENYCFLDWTNKSKFDNYYGEEIKLSDDLSFDQLYEYTNEFYKQLNNIGLADPSIPIGEIMSFIKFKESKDNDNKKLQKERDKEISNNNSTPIVGNPETIAIGYVNLNKSTYSVYSEKMGKNCLAIDTEYVKLLLKGKNKPTGKVQPISGADYVIDFSKGKDPVSIIRDSWKEKIGDQRDKFKYDLKNDRQAAFGSLTGMVGGIAGSAATAIFTKNIWATSAGFTLGLRIGNGVGQEIRNSGEFLYEQISGNTIDDGNNGVQSFGQGFLRGVGALDQNYEYVGTAKFLSGLGFDYLSTVATFGLSQKFGGFLGKLEGIKFAGGALKFGMEELILENFFVDIPMNIVQTGFETFTGIDDGIIIGNTAIGNTAIGNQYTQESGGYKSGSISDALIAMKDAATQNLSFENLSQTFFNTVIYGGFLEGGGAAIKKMKGYLPSGQVSNFIAKSSISSAAYVSLTNYMSSKNIRINKDGKCIDATTNIEISETDTRFQELCNQLNGVKSTMGDVLESFETIMETQKQMVSDPENRTGLLFRLGLISPTNTPLNILKKKKELVEKKLNEVRAKGDNNEVNQLQKLLNIYTDAEAKLGNDYFDGKSHQFNVTEQQARGNSEMMDNIVRDITLENQSEKFQGLRAEITNQYKEATGEELNFTDEQLLSILDAHEQDGKLGELTLGQLKQKVKILDETITDPKVRRFLLEAGFCGKLLDKVKVKLTPNLERKQTKNSMKRNVDRFIPQSYFIDSDVYFEIGYTRCVMEQSNGNYYITNLNNNQVYELRKGIEYIIGTEGNIPVQHDGFSAGQHLKVQINSDGDVIVRDISNIGTWYYFVGKQQGTQYVQESKNQSQEIKTENINQHIENGYKIGEEVNIPRRDGSVTKATITSYNSQTGKYRVEREQNGEIFKKYVTEEDLDSVNNEENGEMPVEDYNEIQAHENGEKEDRGVNTERKEMSEVHRSSDVIAIGDTHGNYNALKGNMEYAGLAKEENHELKWTGKNKKVVFQGDILGDRNQGGMRSIATIHNLREQARMDGGDIDIIIGNHEDFLISYFIGDVNPNDQRGMENAAANLLYDPYHTGTGQGDGVIELLQLFGTIDSNNVYEMLTRQRDQILYNMRESEYGKLILNEICNMKILKQVDDVLYCHTNPTPNMIEYLLKGKGVLNGNDNFKDNIDTLNRKYQSYLRFKLLGGDNQNPEINKQDYDNISEMFLNTNNRDITGLEKYSKQLRERGINMISHGHSGGDGTYKGITYHDITIDGGLRIVDSDFSYGKDGTTNGVHSVSVVKQEGGQVVIGDNVVYTEDEVTETDEVTSQHYETKQKLQTRENYLSPKQIENVNNIKVELDKLGIQITSDDIDFIKNKELTPEQIDNVKNIKIELDKLGIPMAAKYVIFFSDIKLTKNELNNIKNLKDEFDKLGIKVNADIIYYRDIVLTPEQIENLKITMEEVNGWNINIETIDINYLKDNPLRYEQIVAINEIKNRTGIEVSPRLINDIMSQSLTSTQIENLKTIKIELEGIGIKVEDRHIKDLKNIVLTDEQINNLKSLKIELNGIGIEIHAGDVPTLKDIVLTPTQIENLKKLRDESGIDIKCQDIEQILNNIDILLVNSDKIYEGYNNSPEEIDAHQRCTRGRVIETIQQEVQKLIPENRDINEDEIKFKIRTDLITLPKSERLQILNSISQIVQKFNTVRKYIDFENGPYKDKYPNAKALLCAMVGITDPNIIEKVSDNITVIQYGTGLSFFVGDQDSFDIVYNNGQKNEDVAGFNSVDSKIEELKNTLSVIKKDIPEQILSISQGKAKTNDLISIERRLSGKDPYANDWVESRLTVIHEGQHNRNSYFMVDKGGEKITRAKDEIIAYLREGKTIKYIEKLLTSPKDEGGYQYGLEGEARENHKKQVRELLSYANDLIELTNNKDSGLTRDKVINILTYAPVNGWKDLHANITEAVKLHLEREISESKIVKLKDRFIAKMQEWAGNNILLNNLIDFWNNIFPKHGIHLESFWWAGTAEKHNVIDEIGQAESLEEIKYILNNPKYSHIQRGPNNKGGIEISAIIDKVVTGDVEIDFIPSEIRPIVHNFIN